jgi:hypothetical protein
MHNVTITLTADADSLIKFFNNFNTLENLNITHTSPQEEIKDITLLRGNYTSNTSYSSSLVGKDLRNAKKYIKNRPRVKFMELSNYLRTNSSFNTAPSHFQVKNFLIENNFSKYRLTFKDNTTQVVWQKE